MNTLLKVLPLILLFSFTTQTALANHHKGEQAMGKTKAEMSKAGARPQDMKDDVDAMDAKADKMKAKGKDKAYKEKARMRGDAEKMAATAGDKVNGKKQGGNEKSAEMQARRDERKVIKEAYKESEEKVVGKKPWWKFWEE